VFCKTGGSITAAAVTGPARQPRPASSVPASRIVVEKLVASFYKYIKIFLRYLVCDLGKQ
jgi:hypothetical protein